MQQLCIEYFFPLTEQIPLDLDFTPCREYEDSKRSLVMPFVGGTGLTLMSTGTGLAWTAMTIEASKLNLDTEELEFKLKKKPNVLRRMAYKIMGLKWKVK